MQTNIRKIWVGLAVLAAFLLLFWAKPALALDTAADDELLLLVNGIHRIDPNYAPDDLVNTAGDAPAKKSRVLLRAPAAAAYTAMIDAYEAESRRTLYSLSAYRSYTYQKNLFFGKVTSRQRSGESYAAAYRNTLLYTALPGTSEHETGLAIDLTTNGSLSDAFRDTVQGQWLLENCWDYGFILRYDEAKTDLTAIAYEPWHYRYVGLPHSLLIRDNGWVLEEYIAALQEAGMLEYPDPAEPLSVWRIYWTDDPTAEFAGVQSLSSDNTGGWIVTTKVSLLDTILAAWRDTALAAEGLRLLPR